MTARAPRVVAFSLQKSGTHLLQKVLIAAGYQLIGQSRILDEHRPRLTQQYRERLAALVQPPATEACNGARFEQWTDRLFEELSWTWQARLGCPVANRYDFELEDRIRRGPHASALLASGFDALPDNLAVILHEPALSGLDGSFLRAWADDGSPAVIFNYRHPAAALVSMVNFLSGETGRGFGRFVPYGALNRILTSLPDLTTRLAYALDDPTFPGRHTWQDGIWMLHHPDIVAVRYEDLVGARGGGSDEMQQAAVARLLAHLGIDLDASTVAEGLYGGTFTFHRGQIDAWNEAFTPALAGRFNSQLGPILDAYGYEPVRAGR